MAPLVYELEGEGSILRHFRPRKTENEQAVFSRLKLPADLSPSLFPSIEIGRKVGGHAETQK